jgi:hypothetical protein
MQGMGVFLIEELSRLWHEVEDHWVLKFSAVLQVQVVWLKNIM